MKSWADKVLCSESNNEYQHLLAKLGGTRANLAKRVFHFFGINAPWRVVEERLIEAEQKEDEGGNDESQSGGRRSLCHWSPGEDEEETGREES